MHRDAALKLAVLQAQRTEFEAQPMEMPAPPQTARQKAVREQPTE